MSETYFSKFPKILYNGVQCTDISRNVTLSDDTRSKLALFQPYDLKEGLRPYVVADAYYEDPTYDWLIYLTNGIVDPYYAWYLTTDQFSSFINDKYGSEAEAQTRIKEYRLNASQDSFDISPAYFNSLPYVLKKYYSPNYGIGSKVISYQQRQDSWVVNTNKILQFSIDGNTAFTNTELVTIYTLGYPTGNAEIITSNTSALIVKNISGNTSPNNVITGTTSGLSANITSTQVLSDNITDDEYVFWQPVSYYDYESEKNEKNKTIQLLNSGYAFETAERIRIQLKNK